MVRAKIELIAYHDIISDAEISAHLCGTCHQVM